MVAAKIFCDATIHDFLVGKPYSVTAVARFLGRSSETIRNMIRDGRLTAVQTNASGGGAMARPHYLIDGGEVRRYYGAQLLDEDFRTAPIADADDAEKRAAKAPTRLGPRERYEEEMSEHDPVDDIPVSYRPTASSVRSATALVPAEAPVVVVLLDACGRRLTCEIDNVYPKPGPNGRVELTVVLPQQPSGRIGGRHVA